MSDATPNYGPSFLVADALRQELLIRALLSDVRTAIPVKVVAVHPGTGSPPTIGTVDVQPLVQTVDGAGNLWDIDTVYGAPFTRWQSGGSAFIVDPSENDIGIALVCDRDISSLIALSASEEVPDVQTAGPGSARTHDISDLVYIGSIKSASAITQYVLQNSSGITMLSPGTITIQGAQINLKGPINANGAEISEAGEVTDAAGKVLGTHDHLPGTYVAPSGGGPVTGNSGAPV
jgi:hypothetical protein